MLFCALAGADERYSPQDEPPETGWKAAVKYFQKGKASEGEAADGTYDTAVFVDNTFFVDNRYGSNIDTAGQWGLNVGLEWDETWVSRGIYLQYTDYKNEQKFSLLGGLIFPRLQTEFPLYIKGNVGLGYFTGAFDNETLALDYNIFTGLRFLSDRGILFNLEFGSKNYRRIFKTSYLNSVVISSGLAIAF